MKRGNKIRFVLNCAAKCYWLNSFLIVIFCLMFLKSILMSCLFCTMFANLDRHFNLIIHCKDGLTLMSNKSWSFICLHIICGLSERAISIGSSDLERTHRFTPVTINQTMHRIIWMGICIGISLYATHCFCLSVGKYSRTVGYTQYN